MNWFFAKTYKLNTEKERQTERERERVSRGKEIERNTVYEGEKDR
jgi:hypothetical protein